MADEQRGVRLDSAVRSRGLDALMLEAQAALGDGIAIVDHERVCYVNDGLAELCATTPQALADRATLVERVDIGQRTRLARLLAAPPSSPERFAAVLLRGDGKRIAVEMELVGVDLERGRGCYLRVRTRDARLGQSPRDRDGWQRHAFVREASELFASSVDEDRFLQAIAELAVPRFADWCLVEAVDERGGLRLMASVHIDREDAGWLAAELRRFRPRDETSPFGVSAVLLTAKPVLIADIEEAITDPRTRDPEDLRIYHSLGVRSAIIAPMLAGGSVVGVLRFFSGERRAPFSWSDVDAATELGRRAGVAMEHARLSRNRADALRARDELLVSASHELRTPLTALLLHMQSLELALAHPIDMDREALLGRVHKAVQQTRRLAGLVEELLDTSRLTAGKVWLTPEEMDLHDAVEAVVERFRERAAVSGCELLLRTNGAPRGRWDRIRVEQIVESLLSNAIKFAPQRPIELRTAIDGDEALLIVRDHGSGIPPADLPRIFERFEQIDGPRRRHSGLGLGLFLARELALAHGGAVEATSVPGQGATFTVRLPLASPNGDA